MYVLLESTTHGYSNLRGVFTSLSDSLHHIHNNQKHHLFDLTVNNLCNYRIDTSTPKHCTCLFCTKAINLDKEKKEHDLKQKRTQAIRSALDIESAKKQLEGPVTSFFAQS